MYEDYNNNLLFMADSNETDPGSGEPILEDDADSTTLNVIAGIALAFGVGAIVYLAVCSKRARPSPVVHNVNAYDMRPPIGMEATSYGARPSLVVEAPPAQTNVVSLADVSAGHQDNPFTTRV